MSFFDDLFFGFGFFVAIVVSFIFIVAAGIIVQMCEERSSGK